MNYDTDIVLIPLFTHEVSEETITVDSRGVAIIETVVTRTVVAVPVEIY